MASCQYNGWEREAVEPVDEEPANDLEIADGIDELFGLT